MLYNDHHHQTHSVHFIQTTNTTKQQQILQKNQQRNRHQPTAMTAMNRRQTIAQKQGKQATKQTLPITMAMNKKRTNNPKMQRETVGLHQMINAESVIANQVNISIKFDTQNRIISF